MLRWTDGVGIRALLRQPRLRVALAVPLAVDLCLLALHGAHLWSIGQRPDSSLTALRFNLEWDGGYGERWEVLKGVLCAVALLHTARRSGQPLYAALAFGFGLATLDNLAELHEQGGAWIAGVPGGVPGVSGIRQAVGELAVFAMEGLLIGVALLVGFRRSDRTHWPAGAVGVLLLAGLAVFGIGVDLLHAVVAWGRWSVNVLVGTIEDGGELVLLSFAAAYALGLGRQVAPRGDTARG